MTYQTNSASQNSYSASKYQKPKPNKDYILELPPTPRPYNLAAAMRSVNNYEPQNPRSEYAFARLKLTFEHPNLTFQSSGLYLGNANN